MNKKEKSKNPSFFEEFGTFMKPYQNKYILSVLISIFGVAAVITSYAFVGKIGACLFEENPSTDSILKFTIVAIICKLIHAIFLNLSTWISHKAAYLTLKDIRNAVSEKLIRIPLGYFEETGSGRLKTMLVDRIESIEKTLAHMLPELTANLLVPLICIIWMFFIDWRLSLMALLWIILGFSVTFGMMKDYDSCFSGQIKALKNMNQSISEYVNGIQVIKNFGQTDSCYKKYQNAIYDHASYNINWQKNTRKYSALGMAIAPFSIFPILIGGLYFFSKGTLEPSVLILMILLCFSIFTPLMNASNYFDQLAAMGTNAKEINSVLNYAELERGEITESNSLDLDFKDVCFSYEDGDDSVLKNINLHIPQGSMLALVGPSGSGKSTIAKLLAGFWDPQKGSIEIDGKPLQCYSQIYLNNIISYVDQETFLYNISIMENIRLGCPDASDEEIIEMSKLAGCHEFISSLPNGYKTIAGAKGGSLSGGEKQRISIVRAMMKKAPILILDEATASTDPENEASIQEALNAAAKGKTLIVVAHRLSTIAHANQIAYVNDGKIEALGTHEELLQTCASYKTMWELSEVKNYD